jgi:hypothetical protein
MSTTTKKDSPTGTPIRAKMTPPGPVGQVSLGGSETGSVAEIVERKIHGDDTGANALALATSGPPKDPKKKKKKQQQPPKKKKRSISKRGSTNQLIYDEAEEDNGAEKEEEEEEEEEEEDEEIEEESEDESDEEEEEEDVSDEDDEVPVVAPPKKEKKRSPAPALKKRKHLDDETIENLRRAKELCERGGYTKIPYKGKASESDEVEEVRPKKKSRKEPVKPKPKSKPKPKALSATTKQSYRVIEQFYIRLVTKVDAPNRSALATRKTGNDLEMHKHLVAFTNQAVKSFEQSFAKVGCDFKAIKKAVQDKQRNLKPRVRKTESRPTKKAKAEPAKEQTRSAPKTKVNRDDYYSESDSSSNEEEEEEDDASSDGEEMSE